MAILDIKYWFRDSNIWSKGIDRNSRSKINVLLQDKTGILQQNLSKHYRFESADTICEHFNRFIDTLRKERKEETKLSMVRSKWWKKIYVR